MHSNTKHSNFQQNISFRLWVFASAGEYFYYWYWQVLPNVLERKYDAKTFQNLVYDFYILCSQITIMYCILQIGSTGAFINLITLY